MMDFPVPTDVPAPPESERSGLREGVDAPAPGAGALFRSWRSLLILLVVALGTFRVALASGGQLYWPDEFRYMHSLHLLDELRQGNVGTGISWIFTDPSLPPEQVNLGARPAFMVFGAIPGAVQGVANLVSGLGPEEARYFEIPSIANVLVTLLIAVLLYRLIGLFVRDPWIVLVSVGVFSLLANTNVYVRHLFPYDLALCLLLGSLLLLVTEQQDPRRLRRHAVWAGLLAGVAFTTYPGYDPFALILAAAVLLNPAGSWTHLIVLGASSIPVLALWELLARLGGLSFVGLSITAFGTHKDEQGSFTEGFNFLPKYFWNVEGLIGGVLLVLLVTFTVLALRGRYRRMETGLVGAAAVAYLLFGALGVFFHLTVQYGRLLHMYVPFVILAAALAVERIVDQRARRMVLVALSGLSLVSFAGWVDDALGVAYPRELLPEVERLAAGGTICQSLSRSPTGFGAIDMECDFILDNARHVYPLSVTAGPAPPSGFSPIAAWTHPLQFEPYWYEGFSLAERDALERTPLEITLYRRDR